MGLGWVIFLIVILVDIFIHAIIISHFDGTWNKIHSDY